MYKIMQYFYLVAHSIIGDDLHMDKIFLQESKAIKWGRVLATKYPDYSVGLYRQPILETGVIEYVKSLQPFNKQGSDVDIDWGYGVYRAPKQ